MAVADSYAALSELLIESLNGTISDEQFHHLEEQLITDPEALRYYVEFMSICGGLRHHYNLIHTTTPGMSLYDEDDPEGAKLLREAIEKDEKRRAEIAAEEARRQAEQKLEEVKKAAAEAFANFKEEERRRQEKLAYKRYRARQRRLVLGIGTLAASLLLVFTAWIHEKFTRGPVELPATPPIVATVTQIRGAQWGDPSQAMVEGARLAAVPMFLKRGLVKIALDEGAEIILQAPCQFQLETTNQIFLESGNLSAVVPVRAQGFRVRTLGGMIVDYGTRFGVTAHLDGETETHVFQGEVDLRSVSDRQDHRQSQRLKSGEANWIDRQGHIPARKFKANQNRFIRAIPEKSAFGHPGERLDLADIIGGGNGLGTGTSNSGIDLLSGELVSQKQEERKEGTGKYIPVKSLPFVDGVFVPDGAVKPFPISSAGHVFSDFRDDTSNSWYMPICNNSEIIMASNGGGMQNQRMIMKGKVYGVPSAPLLVAHANAGITFDLDAIRHAQPGTRILRFSSQAGILDPATGANNDISFMVLVDGETRYIQKEYFKESSPLSIQVNLSDGDRFLTLICTECSDNAGDWSIFAEPVLELEQKQP